jgi:multidrug efflux pump subunit AcrA (membrane-fusion protein)
MVGSIFERKPRRPHWQCCQGGRFYILQLFCPKAFFDKEQNWKSLRLYTPWGILPRMKQNTSRLGVIVSVIVVIGVTVLVLLPDGKAQENSAAPVRTVAPSEVYLATSTIPLRVSGVVSAADRTVVYAETNGVVSSLLATEGAQVSGGQILAVQSNPVVVAEQVLINANSDLVSLERSQASDVQAGAAGSAAVMARSATEVAVLRTAADDARVRESAVALETQLQSSVLVATEAIDFANNHRSLFSAEGLEMYDTVTANIYGHLPSYFRGGIAKPVRNTTDLKAMIEELQAAEHVDPIVVQDIASLLSAELEVLSALYETGEHDVYDRDRNTAAATVEEYVATRSSLLTTKESLNGVAAEFATTLDAVAVNATARPNDVLVTRLDEEIAVAQADYAQRIAAQSVIVERAREAVAAASVSLGRPTAPFAGTISEVHVDEGQYVVAGAPLVTLVGVGARELVVTVPVALAGGLELGQELIVDGEVFGRVDRLVPVAEGGGLTAVVLLTGDSSPLVGTTLRGELLLSTDANTFVVPRSYVHFDATGPFVTYVSGEISRIDVVYDAGAELYVATPNPLQAALVPSVSISL